MQSPEATLDLALWEDGNGVSVNYSTDVIQDLRRLAVDGCNAFAHGGKEVGGLLYGRREESGLAVLAYAELECEHALGPRFVLSDKDHAAMAALMEPREGLQAIGWFRAHTRSGLELDARDRELFDRYFEHPLSLGLVLKPSRWGPATAAFYVRDAGGQVGPQSFREFAIEPPARETAEAIVTAPEAPPAPLAPAGAALVATEPVAAPAAPARPSVGKAVPQSHRTWLWAMCAGVLLGAVITLALQSSGSRQAHADTPPRPNPVGDAQIATTADRAEPAPAALAEPQPVVAPPPSQSAAWKEETKPKRRETHLPLIVPAAPPPAASHAAPAPSSRGSSAAPVAVASLPAPVTSLPAPPAAGLDLATAPKSLEVALNPLLAVASPPAVKARAATPYNGPRQGRLIWTGDLARRGVFEMDGARVSPGSLTGTLPHVPLALRIMPAELSRDGLIVFTSEPLRDNKTEPPSQSNGWNGLRFKLDAARARELVLLETPNAANDYAHFAVRNDGRPCFVVLMEWVVE